MEKEEKSVVLAVRVSGNEGEKLARVAEKEGRTISHLLREAIFLTVLLHGFGDEIPREQLKDAMGEDWGKIKERVENAYDSLSEAKIAFHKLIEELEKTEAAMKIKALKQLEEVGA